MEKQFYSRRLIVIIIPIICLIPFINKAFHIDDTLFLWCAKQIQAHPVDFYGFTANWYGSKEPMYLINQNPPLVPYYISAVTWLFGWNEIILHIAFLIPSVGFSIGVYYLARSFCPRPDIAALIAVLTPAFLVSSTNIMTDTMMMALYLWATFFWIYGMEKNRALYFLYAAILMSFSALTKYFGMTIIPLMLVYSLVAKRKFDIRILFLIIPVIILIGYQWTALLLYDCNLIFNAASYNIVRFQTDRTELITKILTGLSYTGGCLGGIFFYSHLLWNRRMLVCGSIFLALLFAVLLCMDSVGTIPLRNSYGIRWGLIIHLSLFVLAGILILILAAADLWENRNAKSLLLFLWVFGTFLFASYVNWTMSARNILPMTPAVGILVMRRFKGRMSLRNHLNFCNMLGL